MEKIDNANNSSNLVPPNSLLSLPALVVPSHVFEKSLHFDSNNTTIKKKTGKIIRIAWVDENNNLLLKISTRDLNFFKRNNT